ncbi:MAG TPA: NHLP family bacteriocin export ABC transporter peptidase/permease/ATPase, partial [Lachnospiraceae bacterium]|nr:NHLP family bacteriocin export ABC transporter peptidase/permease/ATPase [Lachnospiraceae bacterium]
EVILLVLYLIIMVRYSVVLSLIGIGAIALTALSGFFISRYVVESQRRQMRDLSMVNSATYTGIDMVETIKVSGAENSYFESWAGYSASAQRAQTEQEKNTRWLMGAAALIQSLSDAAVLLVGAKLIMDGHFTAGMLTAFQGVLRQFMQPASALIGAISSIAQMRSSMERISDVMKYPEQPQSRVEMSDGVRYEKLSGKIEIRNVTFGYSPLDKPLLNDFSLTIHPGDKIAIIGMSGCGKSTIAKLISGLYEPWAGEILYDGKKRLDIPKEVFCGSLMVVDQDSYLFADSIYDNIKLWDDTIPNATAIAAARDAQIHEDIMKRPRGYDYRMREGARDFSGGQRQRMEIARVLAGEPTIAIFDEATSALDAKTEYELTNALEERGITSIVIAHRLSTIRDSDLILVMDRGRVVQQGTHDELYAEEGLYRTLVTTE